MAASVFDFQRDVLARSRELPVLVDFWAEWCGPCRMIGPVLERLAARAAGRFALVKLNTDEHPEIAAQYRVSSIPTVKLFRDGQVTAEFVGALPEHAVSRWLDEHLPSPGKEAIAAAERALAAGDRTQAQQILEAALAADPALHEARVRLAELSFRADPDKALALVAGVPAEDPSFGRVEAMRTLASLARRASAREPPPAGVPAVDWERYLEGARAFTAGRDAEALEAWIDVLRRRRQLDDDGPRRACVALFTLRGDDELTREYRRAFSSALY